MILLRKPLIRKLLTRPAAHRFHAELVLTLHPDGIVELRECRSREHPIRLDLALLYAKSRVTEAQAMRAPAHRPSSAPSISRRTRFPRRRRTRS